MKYDVDEVYASACQYHIGRYLQDGVSDHRIIAGMMGKNYSQTDIDKLNSMVPQMINDHAHTKTIVNLFYSEQDATYRMHIVDLKNDLENSSIRYTVTTDNYTVHGENGIYFSKHLKRIFSR